MLRSLLRLLQHARAGHRIGCETCAHRNGRAYAVKAIAERESERLAMVQLWHVKGCRQSCPGHALDEPSAQSRPSKAYAPWSVDVVDALERRQRRADLHPYTCPNRGIVGFHRGGGLLEPTIYGWECPACPYTQDWAHAADAFDWPEEPSGSPVDAARREGKI